MVSLAPALYALAARWLPYLLLALTLVAGYWYISSSAATEARMEVLVQSQQETLTTQGSAIKQLKADMALQAQLTLDAQAMAATQAAQLIKTKATLKEVMKNETCRDVQLPAAAIDRLRLSASGKD